ncbi:MAG: hypothetical protein M0Z53_09000 [Thermaerobacter sp.]|nr:hypothetical protein [Thermaerobacter sp.]
MKRSIGMAVMVLVLPIAFDSGVFAASGQAEPVTLTVSNPVLRTGQTVTLSAHVPYPLLTGQILQIVDTTTHQVLGSASSGQTAWATYETTLAGKQTFSARIADNSPALTVNWSDQGIGNNTGYVNAAGQSVSLSAPFDGQVGSRITVSAEPSGFANPVYQFWWAMQGGQWHQSGRYQAVNMYGFSPPRTGLLDVVVYAREASAPVNETSSQRARYEAKSSTAVIPVGSANTAPAPGPNPSTAGWVALSSANQVSLGSTITLSASAQGINQPVYQFWFNDPGNGWESSGHYSASATFTVPASVPGTWQVVVYARSSSAPANETQIQRTEYEVESPALAITVHP